jgi:hypothetical protein
MVKTGMSAKDIERTIQQLARSQGMYGRFLEQIRRQPSILKKLEKQNFKDPVDMVLFLES